MRVQMRRRLVAEPSGMRGTQQQRSNAGSRAMKAKEIGSENRSTDLEHTQRTPA
jgi:hypothetical protein